MTNPASRYLNVESSAGTPLPPSVRVAHEVAAIVLEKRGPFDARSLQAALEVNDPRVGTYVRADVFLPILREPCEPLTSYVERLEPLMRPMLERDGSPFSFGELVLMNIAQMTLDPA